MERPRVDHESGTIFGLGHPWVGAVVEALHRGLENGKLRLLTTKSHGDYPADWFTGEVGKRLVRAHGWTERWGSFYSPDPPGHLGVPLSSAAPAFETEVGVPE